jgi:hypothetical protein
VATCSSRASKIMGRLPRLLRSWWGRQGFCKELCYYWATSKVCRRLESSRWGYDFCCAAPRCPIVINFSHYINLLLLVEFLFHTFLCNINNMILALQEWRALAREAALCVQRWLFKSSKIYRYIIDGFKSIKLQNACPHKRT